MHIHTHIRTSGNNVFSTNLCKYSHIIFRNFNLLLLLLFLQQCLLSFTLPDFLHVAFVSFCLVFRLVSVDTSKCWHRMCDFSLELQFAFSSTHTLTHVNNIWFPSYVVHTWWQYNLLCAVPKNSVPLEFCRVFMCVYIRLHNRTFSWTLSSMYTPVIFALVKYIYNNPIHTHACMALL